MAQDITGFGVKVSLIASATFPQGIVITQFADDADPIDSPSTKIGDKAMGLNGDLIFWSTATPLDVTLNVIPGSQDDVNLSILANNNRVAQGKTSSYDIITLTAVYPDGTVITWNSGKLTDAIFGKPVASSGRLKTKPYVFSFESKVGG